LEPESCGYYKLNYFHINQKDTSNANYQRAKKTVGQVDRFSHFAPKRGLSSNRTENRVKAALGYPMSLRALIDRLSKSESDSIVIGFSVGQGLSHRSRSIDRVNGNPVL
jgi:hypothetical protein